MKLALDIYQAVTLLSRFGVTLRRIAVQPCLDLTPNEEKFSTCRFEIMDVLFEILLPHKVSNCAGRHFYPFT